MKLYQFLRQLHRLSRPGNYLEIGVHHGASLALSRVPSIGVDPSFSVSIPIRCDVQLVKTTSDDFFAQPDPVRHLCGGRNPWRNLRRGRPLLGHLVGHAHIDLAFIDGLHHFEFALRDFMNIERHARWTSVIVFDDVLPRDVDEAARDRHTSAWAGDVFKLIPILTRFRPDLVVIPVDTAPTGMLVVLGADASNDTLARHYDEIVAEWGVPDPQPVPPDILNRVGVMDPEALLSAPIWEQLVRARRLRTTRARGIAGIRRTLDALVHPAREAGRGR